MRNWKNVGHGTALTMIYVLAAAGVGCNSAGVRTDGSAQVTVACTAPGAGEIARVTVTISKGDGSDFTPIIADLAKNGSQWSGTVTGIPTGNGRRFDVAAYDQPGQPLYQGWAKSDIASGSPAMVSITLSDTHPPVQSVFPIIDSLTASRTVVGPGATLSVAVTAHDPGGSALTYLWAATCGAFADAAQPSTHWTAPNSTGNCQLSITVKNAGNAAVTAYFTVAVQAIGSAQVNVLVNTAPVINSLTGSVTLGTPMEGDLEVIATDPDGDSLTYAWSSNCATLTLETQSPHSVTRPHFTDPQPSDSCAITVTVSDPPERGGHTTGVFVLPPNRAFQLSCAGQSNGTFCDDSDLCTQNDACLDGACVGVIKSCPTDQICDPADGVCKGGTDKCAGVVCTALDQCHDAGICNPADGKCSNPAKTDGYTCSDGNACTVTDVCAAGACVPGAPKSCPTDQTCDPADGVCKGGTDKCAGVVCTALDQCHVAGTCNPSDGKCSNPAQDNGYTCNDGLACTQTDACQAGVCVGSNPVVCTAPAVCVEPGGTCQSVGPVPPVLQFAVQEGGALGDTLGLGYDAQGYVYQGGNMYLPGWDFGTGLINSAGSADAFVVKLDPTTGLATAQTWAKDFGDAANDQSVQRLAVSSAQVGFIGQFVGLMNIGNGQSVTNPGIAIDYLAALDSANGNGLWVKSFDLNDPGGNAGFLWSVASNPTQTQFAVCGWVANKAAPATLVNAPVAGGAADIVVAVFDAASGNLVWGKQFGGTLDQMCKAVAFDNSGDVLITGEYQGALQFAGTPALPTPSGANRFGYLARLNGGNGNTMAAVSFSYTSAARVYPKAIAVDASGNVILAGQFQASVNFGSTTLTATGSSLDAFVAKLDNTLAAVWAKRLGGPGGEDARAVAVDSIGQVYVTGLFNQATDGVATLSTAGGNDAFLLRLDPASGDASFSQNYGDGYGQEGTAVVATRQASGAQQDAIWISGSFTNAVPQLNLTGAAAEVRKYLAKLK